MADYRRTNGIPTRVRQGLEQVLCAGIEHRRNTEAVLHEADQPDVGTRPITATSLRGLSARQYQRACEIWPRGEVAAAFREPVQSSIPGLLMSGRRDPVTPPRTAEDAARAMPRAQLLVWPYGGHGTDGLILRDCRVSMQREFIQSGSSDQLAMECVTRDLALPFNR